MTGISLSLSLISISHFFSLPTSLFSSSYCPLFICKFGKSCKSYPKGWVEDSGKLTDHVLLGSQSSGHESEGL